MRVLVACEFSGIVRDAFSARGHDAWSCDLLPSDRTGNGGAMGIMRSEQLAERGEMNPERNWIWCYASDCRVPLIVCAAECRNKRCENHPERGK
jgi:hypothetical protein